MKFSKEDWWEHVKEESLSDIEEESVLYALQNAFYLGYICKESEVEIIDTQLKALGDLV